MKISFCFVFLMLTGFAFSQSSRIKEQIDSLDKRLSEDSTKIYRFRKVRPYLNFHNRNSINEIKPVNFYGFQLGAVFFERHIVGYGRYFSSEKSKKRFSYIENQNQVTRLDKIDYHTVFYQFIFLSHRWFELHIPVELGYGTRYSDFYQPSGSFDRSSSENMFMTAYGLQVILKPVRWSGITGNFGYRGSSEQLVNGFYYAVGLWIGLKPVTDDFNYYLIKKRRYRKARKLLR